MIVCEENTIVIKLDKKEQADMNRLATFQNMDNVAKAINEFYSWIGEFSEKRLEDSMVDEDCISEFIKQKYLEIMEKYGVKPQ